MRGSEFAQLSTFAAVVQEGSFRRAAKRMGRGASSISQTVLDLETRLGIKLINRTTRSMSLTEAGALLSKRLGPVLTELSSITRELGGLSLSPDGVVKMRTPRLPFVHVIKELIEPFSRRYPRISLEVTVGNSSAGAETTGYDLWISEGNPFKAHVRCFLVAKSFRQLMVASPAYLSSFGVPVLPTDLLSHQCIVANGEHSSPVRWVFEDGRKREVVAVSGPMAVDDYSLAITAAECGMGIARVPEREVMELIRTQRLATILEDWHIPEESYYFCCRADSFKPAAVVAAVEYFQDAAEMSSWVTS